MKRETGATPLVSISAIAVDTETTGLDAAKARIVQIGAIGIARGAVLREATLDLLVDPGMPIPPETTLVHGISDADVAGAEGFPEAWARFQAFAENRILIGHSIGFDLAVFERECLRAGLPWVKPRALCVRLLASIANPNLADHSLDKVAGWLGLQITGRHSAIGDAIAAGEVFAALIPELRKRNIRTLGEAEVACLSLSHALEAGHRAGWAEPVSRPQAPAFQPVDPYAYRHRVGSLMSHPPIVVKGADTTRQVIELMVERKISSVLVSDEGTAGGPIEDYGIVTERDVMRRIASDAERVFDLPVADIATRPLVSIRAAAFAYRAIGRMDRLRLRHLAVRGDDDTLVGMLSARDLLKLRAGSAINLDDTIEHARDPAELAVAWAMLPGVVRSLLGEEIDPRVVAEIISEELCSLTRRAAVLAEQQLLAEGHGPPPCPYALLVLGSGGRGESLMAPDQDNAIVFSHGDPDGAEDRWFALLGARIADMLDVAGVPYCKGGVMARNAAFRGSLETWRARVEEWVRRSRPEDLLNVDIVYDLRHVHGDPTLASQLMNHAYDRGHAEPVFAKLLGDQITAGNPFTLFGGFQVENGRLDLKKHGLFPIVATARTLAIRHGVRERSTRTRLEKLVALDLGGDRDLQAMLSGHSVLLGLLLHQQTADVYAGVTVSNRVEIGALTREHQAELKSIVKRLQAAPELVRSMMFG